MSALVTISEWPVFSLIVELLPSAAQLPERPEDDPPQAAAAALPMIRVMNSLRVRSMKVLPAERIAFLDAGAAIMFPPGTFFLPAPLLGTVTAIRSAGSLRGEFPRGCL